MQRNFGRGCSVVFVLAGLFLLLTSCANRAGVEKAEKIWREYKPPKIENFGSTRSLTILPLIDFYTARSELKGEPGVSYLIKTDHHTILFDVGFNQEETDPSPLEHNMQQLGVKLEEVDTIFITHNHPDHVGGFDCMKKKTFSIGKKQIDLSGKRILTPIPMTYPNAEPICTKEPRVIGPGIATTGTIPRQLFLVGWTEEQALAFRLEGKGIVLVVGCGHQTVEKLLARAGQLFSDPIYGIVGGLHYPVPDGRLRKFGLDVQPIVSTESPFDSIDEEDVFSDIRRIEAVQPGIVALSAHDSSDAAVEAFRKAFGPVFRLIRVGESITIGAKQG